MVAKKIIPKTRAAVWSNRLAIFAICLLFLALLLHRFAGYPTGLLLNTLMVGFGIAAAAIVLGIIAIAIIWRTGIAGAIPAVSGIVYGLLVFVWPLAQLPTVMDLPTINDVTTDMVNPPQFHKLARARQPGTNSIVYAGDGIAAQQREHYPYVKPIALNRSVEEAFELVHSSMKRLKWRIVAKEPPPKGVAESLGYIEAVERTMIMGFADDIVVRVYGNSEQARIDMRSASRYGQHDLGRNAARFNAFLKMFISRKEATVPLAAERAAARAKARAKGRQSSQRSRSRSRRKRRRRRQNN